MDPFSWLDLGISERRRRGLFRVRRRPESAQGVRLLLDGQSYVNFSSNDYLNLAADPRLAAAAAAAARRYGTGAGASPLISGLLRPLRALEQNLAQWLGTEAALVFSSGFSANIAVLPALAGREDVIFSDALNHASLIDGCRLSRAAVHIYRHADLNHLDELLRSTGKAARRRWIVTDTVFSMDGDLADMAGLLELAERHDALLIVDEAHATGVLGPGGRGVVEMLPVGSPGYSRIVKVGTLSKALGAQGGFVCGGRRLISWLINAARPYVFSTALAPPSAAAARCAVRLVQEEPQRREQVLALAQRLREGLTRNGYDVGSTMCQIVPVIVGSPQRAVALSRRLQERGYLVPAIRPPSVPEGTARLRISLSAGHSDKDVDGLLEALQKM
jgi:8-amino-7-oxononanoate synthase